MQSPVNTGGTTSLFLAFIAKTFLNHIRHVASLKGVPVVVISLLKGSLTRYFLLSFLACYASYFNLNFGSDCPIKNSGSHETFSI
jgi:hypothetical protein